MAFHRGPNGTPNNFIHEKMDHVMGNGEQLPLYYKDKPFGHSQTKQAQNALRRWRIPAIILLIFLLFMYMSGGSSRKSPSRKTSKSSGFWSTKGHAANWGERQEAVRQAFVDSWEAYEKYGWGYDIYHPLSKNGEQLHTGNTKGLGWIIVDALDTLMIMNLTSQLRHAREWVATSLDYDTDTEVNTFETTIRMLGGLLSAHHLSTEYTDLAPVGNDGKGDDLYLEKATDLAGRLIGAFNPVSGVPYASVNLKTGKGVESHVDGGASSTAEATTLQLEFKYLSHLTGEKLFWERAEKVMQVVDDNGMEGGLVPIYLYATNGKFRGSEIRLGSRGDSYYEYLIKQYLQTECEEPVYSAMWNESLAGVRKHMVTYSSPSHFTFIAELPQGVGYPVFPKMDHLVCFMPGTIALGATGGITVAEAKRRGMWTAQQDSELELAIELTKTCYGMYKVMATGLAPEIAHFGLDNPPHMESDGKLKSPQFSNRPDAEWRKDFNIKHNDNHNLQRPETVETLFYMWRITGDSIYREWGWEIFQNFLKYTKADGDGGYTSLAHANEIPPILKDNMESFWLAETLKYLYLLFAPEDFLPMDKVVYNTEAHILPRFKMTRGLKTGWQRKPRDANGRIIEPAEPAAHHDAGSPTPQVDAVHDTSPQVLAAEHEVKEGAQALG